MGADARAVGEALPTEAADEGPLAGVDALVLVQAVQVAEALLAVPARVGSLPRVDALVRLHVGGLGEAFAAVMAGERLAAAVQEFVLL